MSSNKNVRFVTILERKTSASARSNREWMCTWWNLLCLAKLSKPQPFLRGKSLFCTICKWQKVFALGGIQIKHWAGILICSKCVTLEGNPIPAQCRCVDPYLVREPLFGTAAQKKESGYWLQVEVPKCFLTWKMGKLLETQFSNRPN